jgi:hypothetical protein
VRFRWHTVVCFSWTNSLNSATGAEVMRQPLEDKIVNISRAQGSLLFLPTSN